MATWFEITYTGKPTEADYARVAELAAQGFTSGQLISEPEADGPRTEYESQARRAGRAMRDGERFEACRFGERVSACYHTPRCSPEVPGFGRYVPIARGMKFEHARLLDPQSATRAPARCTVTSVRHGRVYYTYTADYEAGDHKGAWYFKLEDTAVRVGRWL